MTFKEIEIEIKDDRNNGEHRSMFPESDLSASVLKKVKSKYIVQKSSKGDYYTIEDV